MDIIVKQVALFTVFFARTSAFVFVLPVFGNKAVPLLTKIGFSGFLCILLFSVVGGTLPVLPTEIFPFMLVFAREVFAGLAMGFIVHLVFAGFQMAGEIAGRQMGFALAHVINPDFRQSPIIGEFYLILVMLIFLILNGHHFLLQGFVESYRIVPIGQVVIREEIGKQVVIMASGMFQVAVKIAAPVLVALLLTNVALGVLARTVPQMNVFFVGLPLRIGIGFLALIMTISFFVYLFQSIWSRFQDQFIQFIGLF